MTAGGGKAVRHGQTLRRKGRLGLPAKSRAARNRQVVETGAATKDGTARGGRVAYLKVGDERHGLPRLPPFHVPGPIMAECTPPRTRHAGPPIAVPPSAEVNAVPADASSSNWLFGPQHASVQKLSRYSLAHPTHNAVPRVVRSQAALRTVYVHRFLSPAVSPVSCVHPADVALLTKPRDISYTAYKTENTFFEKSFAARY